MFATWIRLALRALALLASIALGTFGVLWILNDMVVPGVIVVIIALSTFYGSIEGIFFARQLKHRT